MANDDLKQVVDDLLEKLEANKEFYDTAANNAVHPQLKELLQERAQRRARFAVELESWEGEKTDVEGDGLEAVQRGLMTIKAAMTIERDKTDDVVLADTQEADARLLESYRQVFSEDLPAGLRGLIKRQYEQIHAAYAYVGTRLEEGDQPIVIGLFASVVDARQAVNTLELAGFDRQRIGVLAQDETVRETLGDDTQQSARETAGAAALSGGIIGGLIGLAAGLTIPIVFPVLAAGTIAAALGVAAAGAGIGASYGGIFGALIGWGIAEDETHRYVESVRRGEILIAVHTDPERTEEAAHILRQAGGHSIATRYEAPEEA